MKKVFKCAMFGMLFLLSIFGIKEVHAETYTGQAIWPSEYISNIYIKKVKPNGYTKYQQAQFIRKSEDNKFVYCLQPYVEIDNNLPYYEVIRNDYASVLGLTEEQWDKISLLAYYGYGYENHTEQKWYVITQVMIWRTTNPESDIYFTDKLNGNKINKFDDEIAELENLVSNHYKSPNLSVEKTLPLGQSTTVTDTNNVLNKYKITSTENVTASINGNQLKITATGIGNGKVNLALKDSKYELPPIVYYSDHSQNVMRVGSYDPIYTNITLNIIGGRIEINKLDSECNCKTAKGEATLAGAKYGIYDTSGELIEELTTDDNAYAISNYLPSLGEFIIKEISPSNGYTLDKNSYSVMIDENNLLASVNVYEKVITGKIHITKVFAQATTGIMTPETNITFAILNNKNEVVKKVTTDENGMLSITLPFGSYILRQLNSTSGYEVAKDYSFSIDKDGIEIRKIISNAEITAKLKVIKIDKDTGEVIKRAGIKFQIINAKTGEIVKQKITYPTVNVLDTFETDENGILVTPYPLNTGTYYLKEVDQVIDGYLWNDKSVEFTIDENTKFVTDDIAGVLFETKFENKEVKGNVIIKKNGEEVKFVDNSIQYNKINLEGVKIGLYANEDIYSANGILKFKKDSLISENTTDENGTIEINNLYLGSYYLKELETIDTHVLDNKKYEFELKYNDQYTPIIKYEITMKNLFKKGNLEFTKTDLVNGEAIPNTKIEIYTDKDELIYSGVTDEKGMIVIEELPVNQKFYILEIEPATGFVITEEKVFFEIKDNGEIVKATMANKPITGNLEFTKLDLSSNEPLPNTLIEIYTANTNELVFSGKTDENGMIIIENLRFNDYVLYEKEAPESYILNEEPMYFSIKEDGEVVKLTMTNERIVIEVPNTESNSYIIPISLLLIGLATGVIIYEEVKKRKNK